MAYQAEVRRAGEPPRRQTFARLSEARRWAAGVERAIQARRAVANASDPTLADAIDRYAGSILEFKAPRTRKVQASILRWWRERLGHVPLRRVTAPVLSAERDCLLREPNRHGHPRGPACARAHLAALSHVFAVAQGEWGWVASNPVAAVTKPPAGQGRVRFLTEAERAALLKACEYSKCPDLRDLVLLALGTGARKQELLSLTWRDVDLEAAVIRLTRTKTGTSRTVPLSRQALEVLRRRRAAQDAPDRALVFPSQEDPSKPVNVDRAWRAALVAANLSDFHFHDLRHTAASWLAMSGAGLTEIQAVLGHRNPSMTLRYAHLTQQTTGAALERMDARFLNDGRA